MHLLLMSLILATTGVAMAEPTLLFEELFEDTNWASRGWYDGPHMELDDQEHLATGGHSCVWRWVQAGDISPRGGGARVRLTPTDDVVLEYSIKHSSDWTWTGVPWHPHEFHFVTNADDSFVGPAYTHLTTYIEVVNGVPRVAMQDGRNVDEARIGENLVGVTEARSVAGCNGDADGYGPGDCYRSGDIHVNGKIWEAGEVFFGDAAGPRYQGDWHQVRARLRLNSVVSGIGLADGIIQYWLDGQLLMDHRQVVFRTGAHPDMLFDQFLMAPYFGPGVPHPQSIWIDDLRIWAGPGPEADPTVLRGADSTWGQVKGEDH